MPHHAIHTCNYNNYHTPRNFHFVYHGQFTHWCTDKLNTNLYYQENITHCHGNTTAQEVFEYSFVAIVTVYKQPYFNVNSQPCTKTIVGVCRSAHENMTAVANDNSEHN